MNARGIADVLEQVAVLLELRNENQFKVRAYRNAARALKGFTGDLPELVREGRLSEIKGVGKGLAEKVTELVETGELAYLAGLRASFPPGLLDLLALPGLGPRRVKTIHDELGVSSIGELEYACKENRLVSLDGFGPKTQENVLQAIAFRRSFQDRHLRHHAQAAADTILAALRAHPAVERIEVAGSLRRGRETIKDVDVVSAVRPEHRAEVADMFVSLDGVDSVIARGETKCSVRLADGINADLRMVSASEYAAALSYFTGSKDHNTAVRARAKVRGFRLNEYGLFREGSEAPEETPDEAAIYGALGLAYIEPELREDMGEIEAAEKGELPSLVTTDDVLGYLHVHTNASDGSNTVEELARAVLDRGGRYLGICDHSRSAAYAGGLGREAILRQWEEIDAVNALSLGVTVLKGIESDILGNGGLDYDDEILAGFDFVIASIHSGMKMNEKQATDRILAAIRHPAVTILGHPTGRLLLAREGYPVDLGARDRGSRIARRRHRAERLAAPAGPGLDMVPPREGARSEDRRQPRCAFGRGVGRCDDGRRRGEERLVGEGRCAQRIPCAGVPCIRASEKCEELRTVCPVSRFCIE